MLTSEKVCLELKRFDRPEKFQASDVSLPTGQHVKNNTVVTCTYYPNKKKHKVKKDAWSLETLWC